MDRSITCRKTENCQIQSMERQNTTRSAQWIVGATIEAIIGITVGGNYQTDRALSESINGQKENCARHNQWRNRTLTE